MEKAIRKHCIVVLGVLFLAFGLLGTGSAQDIPDAPSTSQPPPPAPAPLPAKDAPANPTPAANTAPPSAQPGSEQVPVPGSDQPSANSEGSPGAPPPMKITTVPPSTATQNPPQSQEELFKLSVNVNQVIVPVRVTDESGRLVSGLLAKDFSVYEDGKKQIMNFFTSDPFALSAAVIMDLGMSDTGVQKVNQTFPALEGAFASFDEIAVYAYSTAVSR
jgi:hypothetical protein